MSFDNKEDQNYRAVPIRVAIVGAGNMAKEHARAFASLENVEVVGIASRTRSKAETLAAELGIAAVYDSVDDLYQQTQADIVVVAVSVLAIPEAVEQSLNYPWTILAEKPIGLSVEESERIANLAAAKQRPVYVALNRRHYSSTLEAQRLLAEQTGPRFIHVMDQQSVTAALNGGHPEEVAHRFMYANSIHLIDYFSVFGRGEVLTMDIVSPWNPEDPGPVIARIAFDSGDIGLYQAIWNAPGPWSVTVNQGDLRVEMRPLETLAYQRAGERKLTNIETNEPDGTYKPGLRRQAEKVIEQITLSDSYLRVQNMREVSVEPSDLMEATNDSSTVPTIRTSLATMRLIAAIYR